MSGFLFIIFVLIGYIIPIASALLLALILHTYYEEKQFASVQGKITEFEPDYAVVTFMGNYSIDLEYTYTVDGEQYTSRIVRAANLFASSKTAQRVAEQYSQGMDVTVYYNPKNPKRAVLQRGLYGTFYAAITAVIITVPIMIYLLMQ